MGTGSPVENQLTRQPVENQLTRQPVENQLTRQAVENQLTRQPVENQLTRQPVENQLTRQPEEKQLMPQPDEKQLMPQPDEKQLTPHQQSFAGAGLSTLPTEVEDAIRALSTDEATELHNRLTTGRKRLLGVSDSAMVAQRLGQQNIDPALITQEIVMLKRSEVKTAKTAELIAAYNQLTGKTVKRFATRAAAEKAVTKVLPAEEKPAPAAKKDGAKKEKAAVGRKPAYTKVTATPSKGIGRLNESSARSAIMAHLKAHYDGRAADIEALEKLEKFGEVRAHLAKLAIKNWVTLS